MFETATIRPKGLVVDRETFTDLYQKHTAAVFNYCFFRVNDPVVAEDLTADIFERAWKARRRYRAERAEFSTWLFTIARRRVTDWQRRQSRRSWLRLNERQPDDAASPETVIEESEAQARLRQLVGQLEPREQELIALKFGAGMTNRAIAALIGKGESAVGSALHRVMKKLRAQWEAQE